MRQFLTLVIAVHWSTAFALLAGLAALDAETGSRDVLTYLGGAAGLPADTVGSTGLSLAFALVAALFLWVFVAAAVDRDSADRSTEEVARMAIISGSVVVALLALTSLAGTSAAFFPALAAVFASLLCSLMAIVAERRKTLSDDEIAAAIRLMAVGAANRAMLSRLSGRQGQSAMTGVA